MNFLGIGPMELILILVVALIVFGPRRLPEIGAALGKALREFREMSQDITSDISRELEAARQDVTHELEATHQAALGGGAGDKSEEKDATSDAPARGPVD